MSTTVGRSSTGRWSWICSALCRVTGASKKPRQQASARLGGLVERPRGAGHLREDGKQPGTGRGLEHEVAAADARRPGGDGAGGDRRRQLLALLGRLGATPLARQPPGEARGPGTQTGGDREGAV